MTDHRVSDFVFKKSNVVAPASTYPVKATWDTVSVDLLLLLQQYISVGYDSREQTSLTDTGALRWLVANQREVMTRLLELLFVLKIKRNIF